MKILPIHQLQCVLLFITTIALGTYNTDAEIVSSVSGSIYLRVGSGHLRISTNTTAPVVVYDEMSYVRTIEKTKSLVETTYEIPITKQVTVPANTAQTIVGNRSYSVTPNPTPRIIDLVVSTQTKVAYQEQTIENIVYIPSDQSVIGSQVVYIKSGIPAVWVRPSGYVFHAGIWVPRYVSYSGPVGVVKVGGFWRYKTGEVVKPLAVYHHKKVSKVRHKPKKRKGWW